MRNFYLLGSLNYHDKTILEPILKEVRESGKFDRVMWYTEDSAHDCHIDRFLDNTMKYWNNLIDYFVKNVENNSVVLMADFWCPAIISMKYYSEATGMNVKFYGLHHGSSEIPGDFSSKFLPWIGDSEKAWYSCYDGVFVGSSYVKNIILDNTVTSAQENKLNNKLHPVYLPVSYIQKVAEEANRNWGVIYNSVIFPMRMEQDKRIDKFFNFAKHYKGKFKYFARTPLEPSEEIKKQCKELNIDVAVIKDRKELFELERQMEYIFSFAEQETFGYGVLEAVLNGCKPILVDFGVYRELYPKDNLFIDETDIDIEKVKYYDINYTLDKIGMPEKEIVKTIS